MCRKRLLAIILSILALDLAGCGKSEPASSGGSGAPKEKIKVGLLMETYDVDRWKRDRDFFEAKARAMGAEVMCAVADADQDRQNKQADTFLTRGANALVVIPKNLETAARIVKSAREKGVPVVAYDRLIQNCELDLYVAFDNERIGYLQAKGVLEKVPEGNFILLGGATTDSTSKLLRKGQRRAIAEHEKATGKKITILADPYLENWDRDEARRRISNLLTKLKADGKTVNAIVASNDSTAGGVVAALTAEQLQGKVAVSGQDADLDACQRVVEGTQAVTVYHPIEDLATVSAEAAVRLARGEKAEDVIRAMGYEVNRVDNGAKKVPSIFLKSVIVTKDTMADTVVKAGWHSLEKVYANVPKDQWPKK